MNFLQVSVFLSINKPFKIRRGKLLFVFHICFIFPVSFLRFFVSFLLKTWGGGAQVLLFLLSLAIRCNNFMIQMCISLMKCLDLYQNSFHIVFHNQIHLNCFSTLEFMKRVREMCLSCLLHYLHYLSIPLHTIS